MLLSVAGTERHRCPDVFRLVRSDFIDSSTKAEFWMLLLGHIQNMVSLLFKKFPGFRRLYSSYSGSVLRLLKGKVGLESASLLKRRGVTCLFCLPQESDTALMLPSHFHKSALLAVYCIRGVAKPTAARRERFDIVVLLYVFYSQQYMGIASEVFKCIA